MALPFKNPVSQCMPGFGSPSYQGSATQTGTATGTITITIGATATTPSTSGVAFNASGGPAPSSGKWHMRVVGATSTTTAALTVQVSDGTVTVDVASIPAAAANGAYDYTGEFKTDLSITSVAFVVVGGGTITSIPIDCEVALV
jgi:hypothetical protein